MYTNKALVFPTMETVYCQIFIFLHSTFESCRKGKAHWLEMQKNTTHTTLVILFV